MYAAPGPGERTPGGGSRTAPPGGDGSGDGGALPVPGWDVCALVAGVSCGWWLPAGR